MVDHADGWSGIEGLLALRERLHRWAATAEGVREAVAFGSTERADRPADDWSDLDLLVVVDDTTPWLADLGWTDAIGPSWLRFVHPAPIPGISVVQVLFGGAYDVDLVPVDATGLAILEDDEIRAAVIGAGARIVRPGDGRLAALLARTGDVPGIAPPDAEAFGHLVAAAPRRLHHRGPRGGCRVRPPLPGRRGARGPRLGRGAPP